MAGYNSIGAYTATSIIPAFRGLMQYGDGINTDPRYAVDAVNADTPGGVLQPLGCPSKMGGTDLEHPIETLASLYRRWHTGDEEKLMLIAAAAGHLYARHPSDAQWTELEMPEDITQYQSDEWSWVAYEINPEGSTAPVDVLLLSNAYDGMIMVRGDTLAVSIVNAPKKFGVIERYAERIWGGAILDDPDMLVYSTPYDPTNWEANLEFPEDGAGDVMQPSWDGDSFTALRAFGSQLIAFKKTRVWRILGTNPGEYSFREQYGGGAPYAATITVDTERIFMLTDRGIAVYDGTAVTPFYQEYAQDVFSRMNRSAMDCSCACLYHDRYYCAIPLDGADHCNAVLVYNTVDHAWLLYDDTVCVSSFLPTEEALYFTSPMSPSAVLVWNTDSWENPETGVAALRWVSPWNDLGRKDIGKGSFEVYLLAEVQSEPVTLSISVQTEKKTKTKHYTIQPVRAEGKAQRQKRLHFGGTGRRFRLIIEAPAGAAWRLTSGVLMLSEIDPD